MFQENAGNISHRLSNVVYLVKKLQCSVMILSYRGYGQSSGRPTEYGIQQDAQAALSWLLAQTFCDKSRLFVFGRSLGGAVAVRLVADNPLSVQGLIIENTFTSIIDMSTKIFPFLLPLLFERSPLRILVRHKYHTIGQMGRISEPILFICSGKDEMVPPAQMRELWKLHKSPQCEWLAFPNGGHMDTWYTEQLTYWPALRNFLEKLGAYQ